MVACATSMDDDDVVSVTAPFMSTAVSCADTSDAFVDVNEAPSMINVPAPTPAPPASAIVQGQPSNAESDAGADSVAASNVACTSGAARSNATSTPTGKSGCASAFHCARTAAASARGPGANPSMAHDASWACATNGAAAGSSARRI